MTIVVDTTAETVRAGQLDERRRRRLRIRTRRLNETAMMVQGQIEDRVNPGALWPGVSGEDLGLWLFDAELTVERLATAGARAAAADIPAATRAELADTVALLARAIRIPHSDGLALTAERAERLFERTSYPPTCRCAACCWQQSTRRKRLPTSGREWSASWPEPPRNWISPSRYRRRTATTPSSKSGQACSRRPGKPSRWPSPQRWPS